MLLSQNFWATRAIDPRRLLIPMGSFVLFDFLSNALQGRTDRSQQGRSREMLSISTSLFYEVGMTLK
jgi:hypothetical protein